MSLDKWKTLMREQRQASNEKARKYRHDISATSYYEGLEEGLRWALDMYYKMEVDSE